MRGLDATSEKAFAAEEGIGWVRVATIALNSFVYLVLMDKAGTIPALAYAIIVLANAYGLSVVLLRPHRRFPALLSSYFTSFSDAAFITAWLLATGGFSSPFYVLWLLSVTAIAFRFGLQETIFAAVLYAASYLTLLLALGQVAGHATELTVRIGYIFLVAAIGGLLAREGRRQTEEKFQANELAAQLRESEERFRLLSDGAFEGVAIHEDGRLLECNRAFAHLFGYDASELVGRRADELVDPADREMIRERIRSPRDDAYEVRAMRRDGTTFTLELAARDLPYHGRTVRVVTARDISEIRRAEQARRDNERLRETNAVRTQFINSAAHELGTPMTPIKLQAHLLRGGHLGPLTERQQKSVDLMARNVDHLNHLVHDLLEATRLQSGRLDLRRARVDVADVVARAVESFEAPSAQAGISLSIERASGADGTLADVDEARVTQIAFNLMSNALKATERGGAIRVRVGPSEKGVLVEVADTGLGIPLESQARLFRPFTQIHEGRPGTGLGLYITKGIVEQHGGWIECESAGEGHGATFRVWLPREAPPLVTMEPPL